MYLLGRVLIKSDTDFINYRTLSLLQEVGHPITSHADLFVVTMHL